MLAYLRQHIEREGPVLGEGFSLTKLWMNVQNQNASLCNWLVQTQQITVGMASQPWETTRSGILNSSCTSEPRGGAFRNTNAQALPSRTLISLPGLDLSQDGESKNPRAASGMFKSMKLAEPDASVSAGHAWHQHRNTRN